MAIYLMTTIPEREIIDGLEYGAHISGAGKSGYYVRPLSRKDLPMGVAWMRPDGDFESDDITAIVQSITDELEEQTRT